MSTTVDSLLCIFIFRIFLFYHLPSYFTPYRLPCRWEGIDIVVYDDIVDIHIVKPYTSSDCSAKGGGDEVEGRLSYIKRVVRYLFTSTMGFVYNLMNSLY